MIAYATHPADSFLNISRSFFTLSMSNSVLDEPRSMLKNRFGLCVFATPAALSLFTFPAVVRSTVDALALARLTWLFEKMRDVSNDFPRECVLRFGLAFMCMYGALGGVKMSCRSLLPGRAGELMDSMLCARRRLAPRGGVCGGSGRGRIARVCEDLTIAALTVASMPASLGRRVGGIWRSSCLGVSNVPRCSTGFATHHELVEVFADCLIVGVSRSRRRWLPLSLEHVLLPALRVCLAVLRRVVFFAVDVA